MQWIFSMFYFCYSYNRRVAKGSQTSQAVVEAILKTAHDGFCCPVHFHSTIHNYFCCHCGISAFINSCCFPWATHVMSLVANWPRLEHIRSNQSLQPNPIHRLTAVPHVWLASYLPGRHYNINLTLSKKMNKHVWKKSQTIPLSFKSQKSDIITFYNRCLLFSLCSQHS